MRELGSRVVRVFISSTFRDFQEERRLLVNEVFPELRRRARERFVEVVEVDLRWGITQEEAERGETLPICLREIERSRPHFVGMLGERYGWVPERGSFSARVLEAHPWLAPHAGSTSVTEIEMLHGVLNAPEMAARALFYLRDSSWARDRGADFLESSSEQSERLSGLKERIRRSVESAVRSYDEPATLARQVLEDLWARIDADFPEGEVPDAIERERLRHESWLVRHLGFLVGCEDTVGTIEASVLQCGGESAPSPAFPLTVVLGPAGSGKSAVIAGWMTEHARHRPQDPVLLHVVGASAESHEPEHLRARIIEWIRRVTGRVESPREGGARASGHAETDLAAWFGVLATHALQSGAIAVLVVDGLDRLGADHPLAWLPRHVPHGVAVVVSASGDAAVEDCRARNRREVPLEPLDPQRRRAFVEGALGRFDRRLDPRHVDRIVGHELAASPGFLRVILDELRCEAEHAVLDAALDRLLACGSLVEIVACRLERVERLCGRAAVEAALCVLWSSDAGLQESELLSVAALPARSWAAVRLQLDESIDEHADGLRIGDGALRSAIEKRFLQGPDAIRSLHVRMERFWAGRPCEARSVAARVHHACAAGDWAALQAIFLDPTALQQAVECLSVERFVACLRMLRAHVGLEVEGWIREGLPGWITTVPAGLCHRFLHRLLTHLDALGECGVALDPLLEALERIAEGSGQRSQALLARSLVLWGRGDFEGAGRAAACAAEIVRLAGGSALSMARARHREAEAALADREPARAESALREALGALDRSGDASAAELAEMRATLADALVDLGKFHEAHATFTEAIAALDSAGYRSHLDVRDSLLHGLAILHKRTQPAEHARDLALFVAGSRSERLGPDHVSVAMALHTAAGACGILREWAQARVFAREALRIASAMRRPDHVMLVEFQAGLRAARWMPWVQRCALALPPLACVAAGVVAARWSGWLGGLVVSALAFVIVGRFWIRIVRSILRLGVRLIFRRSPDWVPVDRSVRLRKLVGESEASGSGSI